MTLALKNEIARAAVEWERALHEHVGRTEIRSIQEQEKALVQAVQAYNAALLGADTEPS